MNQALIDRLLPVTEEEQRFLHGETDIDATLYMEQAGTVINSKKMLARGKLLAMRPHTRFVHFPTHSHDYVEVVYAVRGSCTHIVEGKFIVLKAGELLFLSQSAEHEVLPAAMEDLAVNFFILPEFFDKIFPIIGQEETPLHRFLMDCLRGHKGEGGYLHFQVEDVLPIQNLVENLMVNLIQDIPNKRNVNQVTMGLLLLHLMNHADKLAADTTGEKTIVNVLRYIEEHYRNGSLRELSQVLHYDFNGLSREIRRKTGKTYTELVQEKRLSQA